METITVTQAEIICQRCVRVLEHAQRTKNVAATCQLFGIETIETPVASPRANAFADRFVRTVRQDRLDHLPVVSQTTSGGPPH
jgi:hypothetical protein